MDGDGLVIVVPGGEPVERAQVADLAGGAPVIAADSGIDRALDLGLTVTVAVGDFDSVTPAGLAAVEAAGAQVERHPAEKDHTDLDLALRRAVELGARRVVVVGGHGGRADHHLANVLLLTAERFAGMQIEARFGAARLHVVRAALELTGDIGDIVTLLAVPVAAEGVTTTGLRYPLHDATLEPASSRGVSNELSAPAATVRVRRGTLLVVLPGSSAPRRSAGSSTR